MGKCNIDHAVQDVQKKLTEQSAFLPNHLTEGLKAVLTDELGQDTLNEIFHLLKKYDLAGAEERKEREEKLGTYIG